MKNLYMVQPNSQYGNSIYFPYAAGSLVAYAFSDPAIKAAYSFQRFFYKKDPVSEVLRCIRKPDVVGFSCYVWNYEYNKALAREIKNRWPDCTVVFGGHQINEQSGIMCLDYVDYVLLGEGEESFRSVLLHLIENADAADIPNIIFKSGQDTVRTERTSVQIPDRVSPYLTGLFDDLIESEPLAFSAILETNRGCPNRCAFCDWGNIKARVKLYDANLVKREIDWMSDHKIEYCYSADANFGLFPRDLEFVDYIIEKNKQTGFPQKFQATYSKNNPDTVFEINKKLNAAGMSKGATLSFQSMNETVLENIGRKNMPLSSFQKLMAMYNSEGIPSYSELIIGMPGETYATLKQGIEELLECGQHMAINFFNCELLKNSIMNQAEYKSKYQICTARTLQHQYHVIVDPEMIPEYSDIIVSTTDMSVDMWIDCNILSVFVRTFHNLGLLQCFAIYLYYEKKIAYTDFYEHIIRYAANHPCTIIGELYRWLKTKYKEVSESRGSLTCTIREYGDLIWPLEEGAFLKIILRYDLFFEEIQKVVQPFFSDSFLLNELIAYQKAVVKNPYTKQTVLSLNCDFYSYFKGIYSNQYFPLQRKPVTVCLRALEVSSDLQTFAKETIWYGRKGGKNIISDICYL